jgi:hypothetical protein
MSLVAWHRPPILALAPAAVLVLAGSAAHAEEATVYLPIGLLTSVSTRGAGIGGEVTLDVPSIEFETTELGAGLLFQYEWLTDGSRRIAGGAQAIFAEGFWGVEAAVAHYGKAAGSSTAAHLAVFGSCGFLSAALFLDAVAAHSGAAPLPVEVGLAVTVKLPIPLNGNMRRIGLGG